MNSKCINIVLILFSLTLSQIIIANDLEDINNSRIKFINVSGSKMLLQYNFNDSEVLKEINMKKLLDQNNEELNTKSPWLAFFLSLPMAGLGQLYNGDYLKAAIQGAVFIGGVSLLSGCGEGCGSGGGAGIVLGVVGATWLWSIIDAPISASQHNSRIKKQQGLTILQSANERYSLKINRDSHIKLYSLNLQVGI